VRFYLRFGKFADGILKDFLFVGQIKMHVATP
jgi:hypothetical protein